MKDKTSQGYSARRFGSPPDSFSRQLDNMVARQEMPYGYESSPPPMGHQNAETLENIRMQRSRDRK